MLKRTCGGASVSRRKAKRKLVRGVLPIGSIPTDARRAFQSLFHFFFKVCCWMIVRRQIVDTSTTLISNIVTYEMTTRHNQLFWHSQVQ